MNFVSQIYVCDIVVYTVHFEHKIRNVEIMEMLVYLCLVISLRMYNMKVLRLPKLTVILRLHLYRCNYVLRVVLTSIRAYPSVKL